MTLSRHQTYLHACKHDEKPFYRNVFSPYVKGPEQMLEQAADALLQALPPDPECPTFTEPQLARQGQRYSTLSPAEMAEVLTATPSQSALDELAFLASVTPLTPGERACLRGWMLGWTQAEMGTGWMQAHGAATQQEVSRLLQSALRKCYDAVGLSFVQFSRHALYRRPARRKERLRLSACLHCREEYVWGLGAGRYCSVSCREASRHRRKPYTAD